MTTRAVEEWLVVLQALQVAFLLLHDWVSLGRLSNLQAVRAADPTRRRVIATLWSTLPSALGLGFCLAYWTATRWPHWVVIYLWVTYVVLLAGAIQAWWIPYLVRPDPERAARYRVRFAGTVRFLPERNGIAPDALHVGFHAAVVATLLLLAAL